MAHWICNICDDGEPHTAYVLGHVDLREIAAEAPAAIMAGMAEFGVEGDDLTNLVAEMHLTHYWMRRWPEVAADPEDQLYAVCKANAVGAFPVSGARFVS